MRLGNSQIIDFTQTWKDLRTELAVICQEPIPQSERRQLEREEEPKRELQQLADTEQLLNHEHAISEISREESGESLEDLRTRLRAAEQEYRELKAGLDAFDYADDKEDFERERQSLRVFWEGLERRQEQVKAGEEKPEEKREGLRAECEAFDHGRKLSIRLEREKIEVQRRELESNLQNFVRATQDYGNEIAEDREELSKEVNDFVERRCELESAQQELEQARIELELDRDELESEWENFDKILRDLDERNLELAHRHRQLQEERLDFQQDWLELERGRVELSLKEGTLEDKLRQLKADQLGLERGRRELEQGIRELAEESGWAFPDEEVWGGRL